MSKITLYDNGGAPQYFAYGIGRKDNLGSNISLVFYTPKRQGRRTVNEVGLTLIVPRDQIPVMIGMLQSTAASVPLTIEADAQDRGGAPWRLM